MTLIQRGTIRIPAAVAIIALAIAGGLASMKPAYAVPPPPVITQDDLAGVQGTSCSNCVIDVYGNTPGGVINLGSTAADSNGDWRLNSGVIPPPSLGIWQAGAMSLYATATDGTGTSGPSATVASFSCPPSTCIGGTHEGTYYNGGVFNHCTATVFHWPDGTTLPPPDGYDEINGNIDCATAHNGTFAGSYDAATRAIDLIVTYQPSLQQSRITGTFDLTGTIGGSGAGTGWDCYPVSCGGPFPWTSERIPASVAKRIPAASGGTVFTSTGDVLTIGAGALAADTTIEIDVVPVRDVPAGLAVLSRAFRASPDGLQFLSPVQVSFHVAPEDLVPGLSPADLRVAVWDGASGQWLYVGGVVAPDGFGGYYVTVSITHFSDYAVFDCGTVDFDLDGAGDPCDIDDDNDLCMDAEELGPNHLFGGERDPFNYYDFYDVNGDAFIELGDTLKVLAHFGHGKEDDADDDRIDRNVLGPKPWRSSASDDGVDLTDALNNLKSFGDGCKGYGKP